MGISDFLKGKVTTYNEPWGEYFKLPERAKAVPQKPLKVEPSVDESKIPGLFLQAPAPVPATKAKPTSIPESPSLATSFISEVTGLQKQEAEALKPIQERIQKHYEQISELLKKQWEQLEETGKKLETAYDNINKAIAENKLPSPPDIKEIERAKNWQEVLLKNIVPAVVGIAAAFRGDKFGGYNYYYYNALVDTIKKNNLEQYQKLLQQWQIDFEYAKQKRQDALAQAQMDLQKTLSLTSLKDKATQAQINATLNEIKLDQQALTSAEKNFKDMLSILTKMYDIWLKEEGIRQKLEIEKMKIGEKKEKESEKEQTKITQTIMKYMEKGLSPADAVDATLAELHKDVSESDRENLIKFMEKIQPKLAPIIKQKQDVVNALQQMMEQYGK